MADQGSGDSGSKPAPASAPQKIEIVKLAPKKIVKAKVDKPSKLAPKKIVKAKVDKPSKLASKKIVKAKGDKRGKG